ncbi:MAG: TRAP transporter large permease [Eubacteriales bacterium]
MQILYFLPFIVLIFCFIIRIPVGLSLFISCTIFFISAGRNISDLIDVAMSQLNAQTTLIAIPLFILTANVMNSGKVSEYMFTFTKALVGAKRGALAYINIIVSLIFSGMTGSAMADVSGIGSMELEEMRKDGYDMPFSSALTAATSVVGPIFPPSIPLVIYAMLAGVSVGALFLAGTIPAILICVALGVYVWYISKKRNYPKGKSFTFKEFLNYTYKALPALITPVILLGGIYGGVVTATESGALAALYAIIISVFAYRVLGWKDLLKVFSDTAVQVGNIMIMVIGAFVLSHVVASYGVSDAIAEWFLSITTNKYVFLLFINVVFLGLGMLLDTAIIQFCFLPLAIPVARALGIDMVHFGVLTALNFMVGCATPPYGMLCFIASSVADVPLQKVFKEVLPMAGMMIIILLIVTYWPGLVLFIPNLLGM